MRLDQRLLAFVFCCLVSAQGFGQTGPPNSVVVPIPNTPGFYYTNELIVEFDSAILGSSVDELIAAIQSPAAGPSFTAQFGSPNGVRTLARSRMAPAALASLDAADPDRRLQNMVVFDYPSDDATLHAQMDFARNAAVVSQSRNVLGQYSTDPLLPIVGDATKYQWGLYTINALQSGNTVGVWAQTMGSAYIAMLDNGLKTAGGVHEDLAGSYRPLFSSNYGFMHDGPTGGQLAQDNLDETPFLNPIFTYSAGHGTHTAGIVAARNGNGLGGSGVCPGCSIFSGRITQIFAYQGAYAASPNLAATATAMDAMVSHGVQVISESFALSPTPAIDAAIAKAKNRDVVLVAASGNGTTATIDYPANDPSAIAVGGITSSGLFWVDGAIGSNWSSVTTAQQFVAPAKNTISTVYTSYNWNEQAPYNCGDDFPAAFMVGYGDCTGTSMATPHVSGIVGLMRSVDPLKTRKNVRDILAATSNTVLCNDSNVNGTNLHGAGCELGVPDTTKAIAAMLGGSNVLNRKSPLFSFYSSTALDHFYTYVPQMAMTAMELGSLLPQPTGQPTLSYPGIGATISQYPAYPVATCSPTPCSNTPKAIAVILTALTNPAGGTPLVPLYRMSYKCGDELNTSPPNPANPRCDPNSVPAGNPSHLSHFYSTSDAAVSLYTGYDVNGVYVGGGAGYKLDGIEGFVFPTTVAQPSGTVHLCRKYDPTRDDYVLFTGAGAGGLDCSATTDGYTGGSYSQIAGGTDWIGWAYPAGTSIGGTQSNSLPTVSVTQPANGASFVKGTNVTVKASASDSDGSIASVRFFLDEQLLGTDTTSPYQVVWNASKKGTYSLTAIAIDNRGAVTSSAPISVTITGTVVPPVFANQGFEAPVLGSGNYQYNPFGGSWTFTPASAYGGSGISGNGSAFTSLNPDAPEGVQVGFIQGSVTLSQAVNFTSTGTYHLQFYGAQRYGNGTFLNLQLQVDGVNVGTYITPSSTSYVFQTSSSFTISATGSHTITLLGINDGQDNTIFLDLVTILSP